MESASADEEKLDDTNSEVTKETLTKVSKKVKPPDVLSTSGESVTKETKEDVESASAEEEKLDDTNSEVTKETLTKVSKKVKRDKLEDTNIDVTNEILSKGSKKMKQSKKYMGSASARQAEVSKETSTVSKMVNHEKDAVTPRKSSRKKN